MSNYCIDGRACGKCGHAVWSEDPPRSHDLEIIRCANLDCENSRGTEVARDDEYPKWVITIEEWDRHLLEKFARIKLD